MLKLSIITINRNNSEGLLKTIESVVSQTYSDYEYIIIDGGSTDGSVKVIKQYHEKISYWVSESDTGIYNAMNKGILKATGEYCLFLNSGDTLCENNVLHKILNNDYNEDILIGNIYLTYKDKKVPHHIGIHTTDINDNSICSIDLIFDSLPHQASFIKRNLFEKYGLYDESLKIVSDWKFTLYTIVFKNVTTRCFRNIFVTNFDMSGMSLNSNGLLSKEFQGVLNEFFPKKVLEDYNNYVFYRYEIRKYWLSRKIYTLLYHLVLLYERIFVHSKRFSIDVKKND